MLHMLDLTGHKDVMQALHSDGGLNTKFVWEVIYRCSLTDIHKDLRAVQKKIKKDLDAERTKPQSSLTPACGSEPPSWWRIALKHLRQRDRLTKSFLVCAKHPSMYVAPVAEHLEMSLDRVALQSALSWESADQALGGMLRNLQVAALEDLAVPAAGGEGPSFVPEGPIWANSTGELQDGTVP